MNYYAALFFAVSLAAAALGFSGLTASAVEIEKIIFILFLALALLTALFGRPSPRRTPVQARSDSDANLTARSSL